MKQNGDERGDWIDFLRVNGFQSAASELESGNSNLLADLEQVEQSVLLHQAELVKSAGTKSEEVEGLVDLSPPVLVFRRSDVECKDAARLGEECFANGRVGFLLLAGGQGTRLGFGRSKGLYPLDLDPDDESVSRMISEEPWRVNGPFAYFKAQLDRIHQRTGRRPPLSVMVSRDTQADVLGFFGGENGSQPEWLRVFAQHELPVLDGDGGLLIGPGGRLQFAPDGHGGAVLALARSGTIEWMQQQGCEWLFTFQVDNVGVHLFDPVFVGLVASGDSVAGLKVVEKREPGERVGVLAQRGGKPCIVEYSELPDSLASLRDANGKLMYRAGSIAFHVFKLDALGELANSALSDPSLMPLHMANKRVPSKADPDPKQPNAWKFERFIFDALPLLGGRVVGLEVEREDEFLPLKDAAGANGPEAVRAAMRRVMPEVDGVPTPEQWAMRSIG